MSLSPEEIKYTPKPKPAFRWQMPSQIVGELSSDEICEACDSLKDSEIAKLKGEIQKIKKLLEFWRSEARSLMLKTATEAKAMSLKTVVDDFTSTSEGKNAWETAWKEQLDEWHSLLKQGQISKIKYYRLINGIDQVSLAKELGTAQPNISRIEKQGYNVPAATLKKLAKIFGVRMEELIGD